MTAKGRPSPAEFHVLLALVDGAKHGHAIKVDVADRTDGSVVMGPGTLYGAIKRLLRSKWIEEVPPTLADDDDDGRKRFYAISETGLAVAREEAERMTVLLGIVSDKALLGG
ncbi:MAG: PadR family transcriptional regulator [Gemmatimonadota bacterium]